MKFSLKYFLLTFFDWHNTNVMKVSSVDSNIDLLLENADIDISPDSFPNRANHHRLPAMNDSSANSNNQLHRSAHQLHRTHRHLDKFRKSTSLQLQQARNKHSAVASSSPLIRNNASHHSYHHRPTRYPNRRGELSSSVLSAMGIAVKSLRGPKLLRTSSLSKSKLQIYFNFIANLF